MDETQETDHTVAVEDDLSASKELLLHPLAAKITSRFDMAATARRADEERWVTAYQHYRGRYGDEVEFTDTEKSRVFIKVTKTKVLAAYAQVMDVLFSEGKLPLTIQPTDVPLGVDEVVHINSQEPAAAPGEEEEDDGGSLFGFPGDGKDPEPGDTLTRRLGAWLASKFPGAKVKEGPGKTAQDITIKPAEISARRMERKIHDQLEESGAATHIRHLAFECALLGTGILKGPFREDKVYARWDEQGVYTPVVRPVPRVNSVSCWNFYPDPEAISLADADWVIERHKMTRSQVRQLKRRPFFRHEKIDQVLEYSPNWTRQWWEHNINDSHVHQDQSRYEVLEYWGNIDADDVADMDIRIPEELKDAEEFQVNAWVCNGILLRVVLNPFTPVRIPYCVVPYEINPYNLFGVGLAENMSDSQTVMNGFARMAIDNATLAGSLMLEVNEDLLVPGQDMKVYAGKIWRRQGGGAGQAILGTKWPSTFHENMQVFDKFRQLADEQTGIPSFSHGQTGVQGTGRTASGISMLMGAAQLTTKTVIKNFDDYLLRPLGEAFYHFNKQFDFDPTIVGDLEVKARGTTGLMQREVKSQRLLQFMQTAASLEPTMMITNFRAILRELSLTMDLDPDEILLNEEEAAVQAQLLAMARPQQGGQGQQQPPQDDLGADIAPGTPQMPGSPQFQGTPQGMTPDNGPMGEMNATQRAA